MVATVLSFGRSKNKQDTLSILKELRLVEERELKNDESQ